MTSAASHVSVEALRDFGFGRLDDVGAEAIVTHLETCAACRDKAAEFSDARFVNQLKAIQQRRTTPGLNRPATGVGGNVTNAPTAAMATAQPVPAELRLRDHPQFELVRELGRGGMGVVYLAKNKMMGRLEVLKLVNSQIANDAEGNARFLREICSAAKLNHPNIVTAYSAFQAGDQIVLAMEYVDGEDLAKVVEGRGPLPVVNACYYVQQAAMGLQHAFEKGMVHRDIKPHNLILSRAGKKHIVKVLDFGIAKATREKEETTRTLTGADRKLTKIGTMMGTPDYIAPEQILDAAHADIRADIYSLGCSLYFLLTGGPPFAYLNMDQLLQAHQSTAARPLNQARPEVSPELAAVVARMMAKEPAQRYQKPVEVAQALAPFVKDHLKPLPAARPAEASRSGVVSDSAGSSSEDKSKLHDSAPVPALVIQDTRIEGIGTIERAQRDLAIPPPFTLPSGTSEKEQPDGPSPLPRSTMVAGTRNVKTVVPASRRLQDEPAQLAFPGGQKTPARSATPGEHMPTPDKNFWLDVGSRLHFIRLIDDHKRLLKARQAATGPALLIWFVILGTPSAVMLSCVGGNVAPYLFLDRHSVDSKGVPLFFLASIVTFVVGLLILSVWYSGKRKALTQQVNGITRMILEKHREQVQKYGGPQILENTAALKELIRNMERFAQESA